jgi:hypothetical protein
LAKVPAGITLTESAHSNLWSDPVNHESDAIEKEADSLFSSFIGKFETPPAFEFYVSTFKLEMLD